MECVLGWAGKGVEGCMDCSRKSSFTPPHSLSVQHPVHHKNVYEKKKKRMFTAFAETIL